MRSGVKQEIEYYLKMTDDELFSLLGQRKPQLEIRLFPVDTVDRFKNQVKETTRVGKSQFEEMQVLLFGRLCVQKQFCDKYGAPGFTDQDALFLAIADAIAAFTTGVPPFAISALVVKKGLKFVCYCGQKISEDVKEQYMRSGAQIFRLMNAVIDEQTKFVSIPNEALIERSKIKRRIAKDITHFFYESKYKPLLKMSQIPIPRKTTR